MATTIARDNERNLEKADESSTSISQLPDELLCLILKSLTVRDAVRTSVLSRRWRGLWMSLSCLSFSGPDVLGIDDPLCLVSWLKLSKEAQSMLLRDRQEKFITAVGKILQHHVGIGVKALKVRFPLDCEHQGDINRWIKFAAMSGVRELELILFGYFHWAPLNPYRFPLHFLSSGSASHLTHLHLGCCFLSVPPGLPAFSSLESLELLALEIGEEDLHNLLSVCPALERLYIYCCSFLVNLRICNVSSRLKFLMLGSCEDLESLMVSAADLVDFDYTGATINIDLLHVPKLESASIRCVSPTRQIDMDSLHFFLTGLSTFLTHLKRLELSFMGQKIHVLPPCSRVFTNLKHLVVSLSVTVNDNLLTVASFLNISPFLEKLEVDMFDYRNKGRAGEAVRPFEFPHKCLKEVEMSGFAGYSNHIELARFILQSARGLEVMTFNLCVRYAYCEGRFFRPIKGKRAKRIRQRTLKQLRQVHPTATLAFPPCSPRLGYCLDD